MKPATPPAATPAAGKDGAKAAAPGKDAPANGTITEAEKAAVGAAATPVAPAAAAAPAPVAAAAAAEPIVSA
jgi:2-oxoglutarate dehydrogenase E2 component (dihydrolipoamide succinyltransferase)